MKIFNNLKELMNKPVTAIDFVVLLFGMFVFISLSYLLFLSPSSGWYIGIWEWT